MITAVCLDAFKKRIFNVAFSRVHYLATIQDNFSITSLALFDFFFLQISLITDFSFKKIYFFKFISS